LITARQYGEVVLPDDSTGQGTGTLASKLSRRAPRERSEQRGCKEGMAWFLQIQVQVLSKPVYCHGTGFLLGALAPPQAGRYKFDRSQKTVTVQDLYCGQVRVSGCKFQQDLSWEQGAAKTMASLLILPSVVMGSCLLIVML
jgi:hypothetical protein